MRKIPIAKPYCTAHNESMSYASPTIRKNLCVCVCLSVCVFLGCKDITGGQKNASQQVKRAERGIEWLEAIQNWMPRPRKRMIRRYLVIRSHSFSWINWSLAHSTLWLWTGCFPFKLYGAFTDLWTVRHKEYSAWNSRYVRWFGNQDCRRPCQSTIQ